MTFDLVIRNGTVVDGTGSARYRADVGVENGRVSAIGKLEGDARNTIDAAGKIVAPGFVDPHTHYDAQITWDRVLSSSAEHGVTTVVMGNCGVGIAPCRAPQRGLVTDDLVTVEGIDKEVLVEGISWEWESFPEYLDAAERRGSGINLAFLAPLSPFRTYVIGSDANERAASEKETQAIAALLREALQAGAWGFTTTASRQHIGHSGKPLAARLASREELAAYGAVLKRLERGVIELALTKRYAELADDEEETIRFLLDASNRPVTWLSLSNLVEKPGATKEILDRVAPLIDRGGIPQIMTRPFVFDMNLRRPFMFTEMNSAKALFDAPYEKQMAIYADADFRKAFKDELNLGRKWGGVVKNAMVVGVASPELKRHEGRTVGEIAEERGQDPNDAFFDLAVEDNLQVKFVVPRANTNPAELADMLNDSRTMIGLSDGGAHLDMLCETGYTTWLLGHWVREERALTLERAIQRITSEPADFFGFKDRGRLKKGGAADIVVFDENTVGSPKRPSPVQDLPAGGSRLYVTAHGISQTIVNGQVLYDQGRHTGALPGRVLRSA
ncbi:MAG TPA: amidohydrolase family protein [Burkholderiales bacterium]|nr:amidohydrolase family protein [Burkholderiales bacterium]